MGKKPNIEIDKIHKKTGSRDAEVRLFYFVHLRPSGRAAMDRFSAHWIVQES